MKKVDKVNYCYSNYLRPYDESYDLTWTVKHNQQQRIQIERFVEGEFFEEENSFQVDLTYPEHCSIPMITLGTPGGIGYYDSWNGAIVKDCLMLNGYLWSLGDRRFFEYETVANQLKSAISFIRLYSKPDLSDPLGTNNVTFHHPSDKLKRMMQEAELFYQAFPPPEPLDLSEFAVEPKVARERLKFMNARVIKLRAIHRQKRATVKVNPDEPLITRWYSLQREQRLNALFSLLEETGWICAWLSDRVMVMSLHTEDILKQLEMLCAKSGERFEQVEHDCYMCEDL